MKTLLFIATLLLSTSVLAQTAVPKGQPVPEEGIFLTKEQAAKIIAEKQAIEQTCKINQEAALEQSKIKCEYEKGLLKNELDYEKSKYNEINKIRDVQEEKLYDAVSDSSSNIYWFIGGVAVGAVTTAAASVGIVILINQVIP
jgi:hypothetical protein